MKTFYRPEMNVESNNSFSPSAGKPKAFIEYLSKRGMKLDLVTDFDPITETEFGLVHDTTMVQGILNLTANNGFGSRSSEVARSLHFTSGSMYAAAKYAIKKKQSTLSPTSGFHHAGYNYCGGFCTFNGLMVTAFKLLLRNEARRVGIVDLDMHYGDGTQNILDIKGLPDLPHYSFGALGIHAPQADRWLTRLGHDLGKFSDCDIILYQAGADPHIDDPLGGVLTTQQMALRDAIVFNTFKDMKIPVAWNLAGGYQKPLEKVLELHETTYKLAAGEAL